MSSFIRNINRDIDPCSRTVKTSIDIIEDMIIGRYISASTFVDRLIEAYNMHYDLDTLSIERRRASWCRIEDEKIDFDIKRVIFNNPVTIVYWEDGTKTVVKCGEDDTFDEEKGLALCFMKKALDNKGNYNNTLKKYMGKKKK